ncbi:MAG: hypothetical protein ACM3PV_14945 [Betaproteobacteria bacterium]
MNQLGIEMRILHLRPTLRFVALLVGCSCGRKFMHRLDRPVVACLQCGKLEEVRRMVEKLRRGRRGDTGRVARAARRSRHFV